MHCKWGYTRNDRMERLALKSLESKLRRFSLGKTEHQIPELPNNNFPSKNPSNYFLIKEIVTLNI